MDDLINAQKNLSHLANSLMLAACDTHDANKKATFATLMNRVDEINSYLIRLEQIYPNTLNQF